MPYFWLSFVDPARPLGTQFLGVVIVEAPGFPAAVKKAWVLCCNPGGECQGMQLPAPPCPAVPARYIGKLLSIDDLLDLEEIMDRFISDSPPAGEP